MSISALLSTVLRKNVLLSRSTVVMKRGTALIHASCERSAKWYPDAEWMAQFNGPVMYPDEVTSKWVLPPWNAQKAPVEKSVKNLILNFGPQHPAAHGVLRLVLELDGEIHGGSDKYLGADKSNQRSDKELRALLFRAPNDEIVTVKRKTRIY